MRILSLLITLFVLLNQHAIAQSTTVSTNQNQTVMTIEKVSMHDEYFAGIYGNGDVIIRDKNSLYKFKATPEQISTLVNAYNNNHFSTMPRVYPCDKCDAYSERSTITLTFNDKIVAAQEENQGFTAIVNQFDAILNSPAANTAKEAAKNNKSYEFIGNYFILISGDIVYFTGFTPSDTSKGIFLIPENKLKQLSADDLVTGPCERPQGYMGSIYSTERTVHFPREVCLNNELISLIKQAAIKMK